MADDTQEGRDHRDDAERDSGADQDDRRDERAEQDSGSDDRDERATADDGDGFDSLPEKTKAEIKRLRKENENTRRSLRSTEAERDQAKSLAEQIAKLINGDDGDGEPDAEKLAEQIRHKDAELRSLKAERAAEKAIRQHGGDVDAVLDSRTFADKLAKLDPADKDFADDLADLVKATVESSDRYKAAPPKPGSGSSEHSAGGGGGKPTSSIDAMRKRVGGLTR